MPTFSSSMYTGQIGAAGSSLNAPTAFPLGRDAQGALQCLRIEYALSTEATADVINLGVLPIGAKVLPSFCRIVCEDPGTALTLDIGDVLDTDRYCDGAALTTAHDVSFTGAPSVTAVAAQYVPYEVVDGSKYLTAQVVLATALTNAAKITFYIVFVLK